MIKVLIVISNGNMRRMLKSILGDIAEVSECGSGEEVITAYTTFEPEWVLMDIRLSRMNGILLMKQLICVHPGARVIILSEYDDQEICERAREAGACDYVSKDNLFVLRRILGARDYASPA